MDGWINELAGSLGLEPLSEEATSKLLAASRDVAHGVERRITPLSTFLIGRAVERRVAGGTSGEQALAEVLAVVESTIPDAAPGDLP
jgi:hypothetical protein